MKIPLPGRGQPIDTDYLYRVVESINELWNKVSTALYNYTTVDTAEAGRQSTQTSQSMIFASSVRVVANEYVVKDTFKTWYIDLPPGFKYAPNVTCAVVNRGTSTTGNDVLPTITNVTKNRIDGTVKFLSSGTASININITAIGIPE